MREHKLIPDIPHSRPWISDEDRAAVDAVLRVGMIACGRRVVEFEAACAEYLDARYVETCDSGESALLRALQLLRLEQGASVVVPTYVCSSVASAVKRAGLVPFFCDIGEDWCMTEETVGRVFNTSVAAIVAVHIFGIKVDVAAFKKFGVPIIEDCAQCFTNEVGQLGDVAIYSFSATKCLTCGEGGLVVIPGASPVTANTLKGSASSRISDLQAVLGLSQLARYDQMLKRRQEIALSYLSVLPEVVLERTRRIQSVSIFFRFPLFFAEGFDHVAPKFWAQGVAVRRGVDAVLHRRCGLEDRSFPNAVAALDCTVSLPCYPSMSNQDVDRVKNSVLKVLNEL